MEKKQQNQDFIIRKAREEELPEILQIYETARAFMRQTGNETQWGSNYPSEQLVREDLEKGQLYASRTIRYFTGSIHVCDWSRFYLCSY